MRWSATGLLLIALVVHAGCQTTPRTTFSLERPDRHSFATEHFEFLTDVRLESATPTVQPLPSLTEALMSVLQFPAQR